MEPEVLYRLGGRVEFQPDGCWRWLGSYTHGYARWRIKDKNHYMHRVMYELLVGPIPDGLTLDHLCRVRGCVNPTHLEPVTLRENILRGMNNAAQNARKTHCPRGHAYDAYYPRTGRFCRTCEAARKRAGRAAKRAALAVAA